MRLKTKWATEKEREFVLQSFLRTLRENMEHEQVDLLQNLIIEYIDDAKPILASKMMADLRWVNEHFYE